MRGESTAHIIRVNGGLKGVERGSGCACLLRDLFGECEIERIDDDRVVRVPS